MQSYNGFRERPDKDGLYGFIRQPVVLDEMNDIIAEGPIYVSGNPKSFDGRYMTFVGEKDGWMMYRACDRRKKPFPPPHSTRVEPRKMMKQHSHDQRPSVTKQEAKKNVPLPKKQGSGRTTRPTKEKLQKTGERKPTLTYRQEWTRCNNERCKKCKESLGHGPYWYAYWREGTRVRKKYVGKELGPELRNRKK